jgi:hypothetical protein
MLRYSLQLQWTGKVNYGKICGMKGGNKLLQLFVKGKILLKENTLIQHKTNGSFKKGSRTNIGEALMNVFLMFWKQIAVYCVQQLSNF